MVAEGHHGHAENRRARERRAGNATLRCRSGVRDASPLAAPPIPVGGQLIELSIVAKSTDWQPPGRGSRE
jgi:hypothetical protein